MSVLLYGAQVVKSKPIQGGYITKSTIQGTGKTHTMVGPHTGPALGEQQFGLVPRLVRSLFRVLEQVGDTKTVVEVSFVEIFNEEVRDLLSDNLSGVCIDYDQQGAPRLAGLNQVECGTIPEVLACLDTGQSLHQTAGLTILNSAQPASHTLFEIALTQATLANDGTEVHRHSTLQFCELAASDCLTGPSSAINLPGSQSDVNLGLLTLNNVVSALGDPRRKVSHVPYQDSLLTRLLAPALGGTTLTLLLCTVSSLARDQEETLSTLLFACRAANIRNNPQPGIVKRLVAEPSNVNRPVFLQLSPQQQQLSPQQMQLSPQQMPLSPHQMPLSPQQMSANPQQMQLSPEQGQQNFEGFLTGRRDSDLSSIGAFQGYNIGPQNPGPRQFQEFLGHRQPFPDYPSPREAFHIGQKYPNSFPNNLQGFPVLSPNPPNYFEQSQSQYASYNPQTPNHFTSQNNPQSPNNQLFSNPHCQTPQMFPNLHQNNPHHHSNPNFQSPPTHPVGPFSPANFPTTGLGHPQQLISSPHFHGAPQHPPPYPGFPLSPYQQGRPYVVHSTPFGHQHPVSPPPLTSRTTPTSSSPLSHKASAGVHLYLPNPYTSSFSSVSLPSTDPKPLMGNQGHLLLTRSAGDHPNLVRLEEKVEEQVSREEEIFALQFAAGQYKALLSNAENLLHNISKSGEEKEKKEIASWMCSKEESEEAIQASGEGKEKKSLAQILEEEEEDGGSTARTTSTMTNSSDETGTEVGESVEDFDSECSDVSAEDVEAKLEVIEVKFRAETESLVNDAEVHFWTLGKELKRRQLEGLVTEGISSDEQQVSEVAAQQLVALRSQQVELQQRTEEVGPQSLDGRRRLSGFRSEVLQLQRKVTNAEQLLQGDENGRNMDRVVGQAELQEQLEKLQEHHQHLAGQLEEERERKRGLETLLRREQLRIEELERRLREQESSVRETLGASRDLEQRAEKVSEPCQIGLASFLKKSLHVLIQGEKRGDSIGRAHCKSSRTGAAFDNRKKTGGLSNEFYLDAIIDTIICCHRRLEEKVAPLGRNMAARR